MLSMQVFVMREGIVNFVSKGSEQLIASKIATLWPMSFLCSRRHFSTKFSRYVAFCIINTI